MNSEAAPNMKTCIILIIYMGLLDYTFASLSCKSPSGTDIDWFILYKVPRNKQFSNGKTKGTEFFYMQDGARSFTYKDTDITDQKDNPLYETFKPVYSDISIPNPQLSYAMYNDQPPPKGNAASSFAHSKGAVAFDKTSGFWIVSSVPRFPASVSQGYKYQNNQTWFGQTILCVTLEKADEATIKQVFETTKPNIYDSKNFGAGNVQPATNKDVIFKTRGKVQLRVFGKSAAYGRDIYSDLIQPKIGNLLVETWRQNGHLKDTTEVENIPLLRFNNGLEFSSGVDHSKWAVVKSGSWTCIGDINRHKSQFKRGGLSVCMYDSDVANEFRNLVTRRTRPPPKGGKSPIAKKKAKPSPGK